MVPEIVSLSISRIHFPVTTLGPGNRIGVWFQGCNIQCPGCISIDTWAHTPSNTTVAQVLAVCEDYSEVADGVTITGGEPFEQPNALHALLSGIRRVLHPEADSLVYSGRSFADIAPLLSQWTDLVDAVISEPYIQTESQTRPLLGSDNQQLHTLTRRGEERFRQFQRLRDSQDDKVDFMTDEGGKFWMAGIPRRGDMERLRKLLAEKGTLIQTSEQILE